MSATERKIRWVTRFEARIRRAQMRVGAWLFVVNLRILLGFALLPAGLKKVLGEPFTDPSNSGPFHDFLHAFHNTGFFYAFVGSLQLIASALLMTQRFARVGLLLFMPIITTILVFCWSTAVYPTATVVTLMFLGGVVLALWEWPLLRAVASPAPSPTPPPVSLGLWSRCGLAVLVFYLLTVVMNGGIYRPRGFEPDNPAFWTLPALVVFPLVTAWLNARKRRT